MLDDQLIHIENQWKSLFDSVKKFSPDYMENRDQPKQQVREFF